MIDDHALLRAFLAGASGITTLTGSRIYAGMDEPPEGYVPTTGAAVVFRRRGGDQDESGKVVKPSYQFKCYGTGDSVYAQARNADVLYRAVRDALNFGVNGSILGGIEEGLASPLREPDSGWPFTLAFFRVLFRNP